MRIAIDGRLWFETGVGRYIRNLVAQLSEFDHQNEYYLFLLEKDYQQIKLPANFTKIKANFYWYSATEQLKLPLLIKRWRVDIVHFPHFNVPLFYQGPFVVTIHDLIHQHFQSRHATTKDLLTYRLKTIGYQKVFKHAVEKSVKIITPSAFVKNQLINEWNVPQSKIVVTPEGVEENFLKLASTRMDQIYKQLAKKYNIVGTYLYYVGNAHPHKNISTLVKSFRDLKTDYPNLQLVMTGPNNYFWQRTKAEYKDQGIIYTGFVSDEELAALYQQATCLVLPSLEEGFGIPILEAFACGTPVIASKIASLPEVGGQAALYFDPKDARDLSSTIRKLLTNQKLKEEYSKAGLARVKQFSWRKTAQQTLTVYQQCGSL